jgi:hypothetical protein
MVADRAAFALLLAGFREDWEATRDPQALACALTWILGHRQLLPGWLVEATGAALMQRRGKEHEKRYMDDVACRTRWHTVVAVKHFYGLSWEKAYARAAELLALTGARGSAGAIRKSYMKFQRELRVRPALKAMLGRVEDWDIVEGPPPMVTLEK